MPPVRTKLDFVRRYALGEFGNASPTWNTLNEFLDSGYQEGLIHVRNRVPGAPTWYDVEWHRVAEKVWVLGKEGWSRDQLYFSAMAPTERTTIQGEIVSDVLGRLCLYYSTVPKPMRASLIEGGRQVWGLAANTILQSYLNARSWVWLQWLLDAYPKHVIEFSSYSRNWGTIPGENTVWWEVRQY